MSKTLSKNEKDYAFLQVRNAIFNGDCDLFYEGIEVIVANRILELINEKKK